VEVGAAIPTRVTATVTTPVTAPVTTPVTTPVTQTNTIDSNDYVSFTAQETIRIYKNINNSAVNLYTDNYKNLTGFYSNVISNSFNLSCVDLGYTLPTGTTSSSSYVNGTKTCTEINYGSSSVAGDKIGIVSYTK
jgi:hypothetical protein